MGVLSQSLRSKITGLAISQEYVCLTDEQLHQDLTVQLYNQIKNEFVDVTDYHFFLGYKPLIIAIAFEDKGKAEALLQKDIQLHFKSKHLDNQIIASLKLNLKNRIQPDNYSIAFYVANYGEHYFIRPFHQWINRLLEKSRKRKESNVTLDENLYDQVRIAYAIPRVISLVTVFNDGKANLFPTDLHGPLANHFYFDSLRIGGKANEQVEQFKRIVITEIQSSEYKLAYSLGKNHMSELHEENNFPLEELKSKTFKFPLPTGTITYRELEWMNSWDIGIHRVHLFKIIYEEQVREGHRLTHIHQYYAQWRNDHKLQSDYLFR